MRLFLAAELPQALTAAVDRLSSELRSELRGWRWVRSGAIHLTLRFLGEVAPELDRTTREAWRRVAADASPFTLRLDRLGRFPPRGAPRVLWVGVREIEPGGALERLAAALEQAAGEAGWQPESRGFRPHLTLARGGRSGRPDEPPERAVEPSPEGRVERIVLFRSQLEPTGARYTALERFELTGGRA